MAETITPVVHGGRARWGVALVLHAVGATVTAALFGAGLGATGALLRVPGGRPGLVAIAVTASLFALASVAGLRVPVPQLRRQVPDWWRTFFTWPVSAVLYGAGLGVGFLTYLAHGTLAVVAVAAVLGGQPLIGALLVAPFGLARGLSPIVALRVRTAEDGRDLVEKLARSSDHVRAVLNASVLIGLAVAAAIAAATAQPAGDGWARLAGVVVAAIMGWAAVMKLAGRTRWRRTLARHRLPPRAERMATWGVPLAELLVPVLTILGLGRTAAMLALVLLATFSAESLRMRRRVGARIPCGCFGERRDVDIRLALLRNAGIAGAAVVATSVPDASVVAWPAGAGTTSALPLVLAWAGVGVAALTAWRASVWLGRARHA